MSFQKVKSDNYCVGGRHRSSTVLIYGDTTSGGSKLLNGFCSICKKKKSMTVSDNTMQAKGLSSFFKNLGRMSAKAVKKLALNALKSPGRFLEIVANVTTAEASGNPKTYYQHCQK